MPGLEDVESVHRKQSKKMSDSNLEMFLVNASVSIVEAMKKIDENTQGILFIVDEKRHLIGSVTDGDIRRWLIKTGELSAKVLQFMNAAPKYLCSGDRDKAKSYMREYRLRALPILDSDRNVKEIVLNSEMECNVTDKKKGSMAHTPVIIMAGGQGNRLYPYTKILPKPLIPIGDIPIIERIMNCFCEYGVSKFYLTVNYKKGMIKSYFSELRHPYSIVYVEEEKPLGTAGSMKLIPQKFECPVMITNCDVLIEADYESILDFHKESRNDLTIVSALKNVVVPYGVLHAKEEGIITAMEEKPRLSYFVNTGMYILSPKWIEEIPNDTFFHMTDLAGLLMNRGARVGMYPISEDSFLDMGELEEMRRMEKKLNLKSEQEK